MKLKQLNNWLSNSSTRLVETKFDLYDAQEEVCNKQV